MFICDVYVMTCRARGNMSTLVPFVKPLNLTSLKPVYPAAIPLQYEPQIGCSYAMNLWLGICIWPIILSAFIFGKNWAARIHEQKVGDETLKASWWWWWFGGRIWVGNGGWTGILSDGSYLQKNLMWPIFFYLIRKTN